MRKAAAVLRSSEPGTNEESNTLATHMGRWRCDLKPIGCVEENMMARFNRAALEALGLDTKEPENGSDTADRKEQI